MSWRFSKQDFVLVVFGPICVSHSSSNNYQAKLCEVCSNWWLQIRRHYMRRKLSCLVQMMFRPLFMHTLVLRKDTKRAFTSKIQNKVGNELKGIFAATEKACTVFFRPSWNQISRKRSRHHKSYALQYNIFMDSVNPSQNNPKEKKCFLACLSLFKLKTHSLLCFNWSFTSIYH